MGRLTAQVSTQLARNFAPLAKRKAASGQSDAEGGHSGDSISFSTLEVGDGLDYRHTVRRLPGWDKA
jgi:hypothetical protein